MDKISPIHLPDTEEGALCPHSLQGLLEKPVQLPLFSKRLLPEPPWGAWHSCRTQAPARIRIPCSVGHRDPASV